MPAASVDLPPSILRLFVSHTGMDPDLIVFVSHVFTSTSDFVSRPNSLSFAALEPNEYFKNTRRRCRKEVCGFLFTLAAQSDFSSFSQ